MVVLTTLCGPGKYVLYLDLSGEFGVDEGKCDGDRDGLLAGNGPSENPKKQTTKESRKSTKRKSPGKERRETGWSKISNFWGNNVFLGPGGDVPFFLPDSHQLPCVFCS